MSRQLGFLIAAHLEAALVIVAAVWAGRWLDGEFPKSFSWVVVTIPMGLLVIARTFYRIIIMVAAAWRGQKKDD